MLRTSKMFTTTQEYCVTPTKQRPMMRLPERATAFMRDVKRRSLRVKRSKSLLVNNQSEKRKSGKFLKPFFFTTRKLERFASETDCQSCFFHEKKQLPYVSGTLSFWQPIDLRAKRVFIGPMKWSDQISSKAKHKSAYSRNVLSNTVGEVQS